MKKNKNGFTLIEILIVVAIIAMLLAVFLPNFNLIRIRSRDQSRKAGVKAYVEALELYKLNQNPPSYPPTIPENGGIWEVGTTTYMNKTPVDPLYSVKPTEYFYRYGLNGTDSLRYYIGVCLEDETDPEGEDDSPDTTIFVESTCPSGKWYYKIEP